MHRALLLVAGWIAKGHDVWRARVARLQPLSLQVAVLEEKVRRQTVEIDLLRSRLARVTSELFTRALARLGIRRRYGKVHRHGSLSLIERFWKSFKLEYAGRLVLYRPVSSIERSLATYATWSNEHRPHQGLAQRTPDEVHYGTPTRAKSVPLRAVLEAEPLAGDHHLPVLRLRAVA
jgi:putative transposase